MSSKRSKPKWGQHAKGIFDDYGKEHYSVEQTRSILVSFSITPDISKVKQKLDIAANQYFQTRSMFEDAPTHAESQAALKYLQNHARALIKGLEELDDKSWNFLLGSEVEASYRLLEEGTVMTRLGYEMDSVRLEDGSISYEMLSAADFIGAAEFIDVYVTDGLEHIPKGQKGKRPLLSLGAWLNHIGPLWCEISGTDFTLDFHKGQPISEAAIFAKLAIEIIDQKVTNANLITAMRNQHKS